jgi:vitamin B12 transporter
MTISPTITTRLIALAVLMMCAVAPGSPLAAQAPQGATLGGRAVDLQGGAVADATVTLASPTGSNPRTTRTTADGAFSVAGLSPGVYMLQVDAAGFERLTQVVTVTGAPQQVSVVLQIAGFAESIAVAAPRLEEELPQQIEQTGVRVQTVSGAQIENGGYQDVAEALQSLVPGLFLSPRGGAFSYVSASLQGSRTNEILWLVDGVRISNRLYNGTTPLDTLPAHMVERIEIIEGGQGLFYGTQAVGGVINVVTKAFTDDASGRLQGGFDTNDGSHVNLFARDTRNGNRFVLYASHDRADGFESFPVSEFEPSTTDRERSYEVATFGGKYAYDFSNQVRVSAMYQRSGVTLDLLRPARSSAGQAGGLAAAFNDRTEHIASGKVDFTPRETAEFFFKGYYHQWDSFYSERRNVIGSGAQRVISDREFWGYKDYGANLLAKLTPTRGVEYFAGYDFQNYSGEDDVLLIAPNTETVHAVFGQVRTTRALMSKATLAVGGRFNAPTHSESAGVWNVSAQYDFTPNLFTRGTVGTSFRYPDAYELFAIDPTCCFGNPNLKPEKSRNFNGSLGGRVVTGDTTITVEGIGFYREVNDLIVDIDDGSGETTITANEPEEIKVKGVSLVGSAAFLNAVSASLGYTYTRSERGNVLAGGYSAIAGIPSNQVQATVDLHPARMPFGVGVTVNRVGDMFDTVGGFGEVPSGDYTIVDLSGRVFFDPRRRHRINLRLENLFDNQYTVQHVRGFRDVTGSSFLVHTLGVPRTFYLSYSFAY